MSTFIGKILANLGLYDNLFVDITSITFMFSFVYFVLPAIAIVYIITYIGLRLAGNTALNTATSLTSAVMVPFLIIGLAYYVKPGNLNVETGQLKLYNQNKFEYQILYEEPDYYELDTPKGYIKVNTQVLNDLKNGKAFLAKSTAQGQAAVVYMDNTYTANHRVSSHELVLAEANAVVEVFTNEGETTLDMHNKPITVKGSYQEIY